MKTNLLTLIIFAIASVMYSCTKESDNNSSPVYAQDNAATLTEAQRRIIISNCSGHSGCHSSAKLNNVVSGHEANFSLRNHIDAGDHLSICDRGKLQLWFNSEGKQE